jgi:hypothetical protein
MKARNIILSASAFFWIFVGIYILVFQFSASVVDKSQQALYSNIFSYVGICIVLGAAAVFGLWRKQYQYIILSFLFLGGIAVCVGTLASLTLGYELSVLTLFASLFQLLCVVVIRQALKKR